LDNYKKSTKRTISASNRLRQLQEKAQKEQYLLAEKAQKEQYLLAIDLDNHKEKHKKNNIC